MSKAQLIEFKRILDLPAKRALKSLNHKGVTPWWLSFRALNIPFDKAPITNSSVQKLTKPGMTVNVIQLTKDPFSNDTALKEALFGSQVFPPLLSVRGHKAQKWWKTYQALTDRSEKLKMIRQLHFDSLIGDPSVVPVMQNKNCRFVSSRWNAGEFMNWRVLSYAHYRRNDKRYSP